MEKGSVSRGQTFVTYYGVKLEVREATDEAVFVKCSYTSPEGRVSEHNDFRINMDVFTNLIKERTIITDTIANNILYVQNK